MVDFPNANGSINASTAGKTTSNTTLPPSTMPLVSPHALLQAHLQQNPPTRPSNRSTLQTRPIEVNTGSLTHCNGSSVVKIGSSTVVCGVRAEILPVSSIPHYRVSKFGETTSAQEQDDAEDVQRRNYEAVTLNNLLVPNLELSTGCHPLFPANSAPSVTAQSLSQRILSLLHTSRVVRLQDLEIRYTPSAEEREAMNTGLDPDDPAYVPEELNQLKAYWVLYIDMVCISYGGSMFDTAWMTAVAALRDTLLPRAWWDRDAGQVFCSADMEKAKALRLDGCPVPLSFGAFVLQESGKENRERKEVLLDTDVFEEEVCEETGCVTVDCTSGSGSILRIEKSGGGAVGVAEVRKVILPAAEKRWSEWTGVLEKAMTMSKG